MTRTLLVVAIVQHFNFTNETTENIYIGGIDLEILRPSTDGAAAFSSEIFILENVWNLFKMDSNSV